MFTLATRGIDWRYAARVATLAICYLAAARLSLVLAIPPGYATAVWPPSGIAFAALLIWGTRQALRGALRIVCERLSWDGGQYWTVDEAADALRVAAFWRAAAPEELERSQTLAGLVRHEKRPVWIEGAFAFPVIDGDKVLGVAEFFASGLRAPDRGLLDMSSSLGTLLGEFIVRMRADAQLSGYAERMQTLSRRLADAQETERRHVAVELQETVHRNLAAVKLELHSFARGTGTRLQAGEAWIIKESLALLDRTLAACDELIAELRPAAFGDGGLMPALRSCAARFERRTGIAAEVVGADAVS